MGPQCCRSRSWTSSSPRWFIHRLLLRRSCVQWCHGEQARRREPVQRGSTGSALLHRAASGQPRVLGNSPACRVSSYRDDRGDLRSVRLPWLRPCHQRSPRWLSPPRVQLEPQDREEVHEALCSPDVSQGVRLPGAPAQEAPCSEHVEPLKEGHEQGGLRLERQHLVGRLVRLSCRWG